MLASAVLACCALMVMAKKFQNVPKSPMLIIVVKAHEPYKLVPYMLINASRSCPFR